MIPWDRRVRVGGLQSALDGRFDRAPDAAEASIFGDREIAIAAMFEIETLKRKGEQRQRVLGSPRLDVGKERIDQRIVDLELPCAAVQPVRRPFYDLGVRAFRHGAEVEGNLANAIKQTFFLQVPIGIGTDAQHDDDRGPITKEQSTQQLQQGMSLILSFNAKQLLALVDQ